MASQANDLYITISDGNETDPGGETLHAYGSNLTSSWLSRFGQAEGRHNS